MEKMTLNEMETIVETINERLGTEITVYEQWMVHDHAMVILQSGISDTKWLFNEAGGRIYIANGDRHGKDVTEGFRKMTQL